MAVTRQTINGADMMWFINNKSVAFSTGHKMSIRAEVVETSSKDSGGKWRCKKVNKLDWNGGSDNLYCKAGEGAGSTYDDLYALMVAREPVDAIFCLEKDYATKADEVPEGGWVPISAGTYKGKILITALDVNAPNDDKATYTVTFEGTGALTQASGGGA